MQIQGRAVPGDSRIRVTGFRDLTKQRQAEAERHSLQERLVQLNSGEARIKQLDRPGPRPRFVLLDGVMPGMGGDAARAIFRERWPDLRLLIVSGRERPADLDLDDPGCAFLTKPFRSHELAAALAKFAQGVPTATR